MSNSTEQPKRLRRLDFAAVLAIVAISARLVWPGINAPIWLDEQMIAMNIRDRGLLRLVGALDNDQSAPLLWLWVERLLFQLFGQADWVLRLMPMAFGIGAVVVAWWYGRRWLGPLGSAALVALIGFSYTAVDYSSEVKHYSADIFWVFLLIALARWVLEQPHSHRRHLWWWAAALVGSWLSNGATTAAPGIGLVLALVAVWRRPLAAWVRMAVPGLVWLASFAAHYLLSLRPATRSDYLNDFWAGLGYPPDGAGPLGTVKWLAQQGKQVLHSTFQLNLGLDTSPLAKVIFVVFTALFAAGLVITFRKGTAFGFVLSAPLVTAVALALARVIPLYGRLALWLMPPILIAVAQAVDFKPLRPKAMRWVAPAAFLVMLVPFANTAREMAKEPPIDDRAAIAWLSERHRPGDVTVVVATSSRAADWYDVDQRLIPRLRAITMPSGADCDPGELAAMVRGYARVLVYAGVRLEPYKQSHRVLEDRLARLGTITERASFGTEGMTYVVRLDDPAAASSAPAEVDCVKLY